jgi:hypothetical protein
VPTSIGMRWQTWKESSRQLLSVILDKQFYRLWPESAGAIGSTKIVRHDGTCNASASAGAAVSAE